MTPVEFVLKWEQEIQSVKNQWEHASKKGWQEAELIEGARMQGTAKMIEDYYEAHQIIPPWIRRMPDIALAWEKNGYINPEK